VTVGISGKKTIDPVAVFGLADGKE